VTPDSQFFVVFMETPLDPTQLPSPFCPCFFSPCPGMSMTIGVIITASPRQGPVVQLELVNPPTLASVVLPDRSPSCSFGDNKHTLALSLADIFSLTHHFLRHIDTQVPPRVLGQCDPAHLRSRCITAHSPQAQKGQHCCNLTKAQTDGRAAKFRWESALGHLLLSNTCSCHISIRSSCTTR
jgi:hypothetical protein